MTAAGAEIIAHAAFVVAVSLAAWTDLRERRIPNAVTMVGLVVALLLRVPLGLGEIWVGLQGSVLGLVVGVVLFTSGALGAGDAKLLAMVGAFMGPEAFLGAFALASVLGALLAVLEAGRRGVLPLLLFRLMHLVRFRRSLGGAAVAESLPAGAAMTIPYGVPIAMGALIWRFGGTAIAGVLFS